MVRFLIPLLALSLVACGDKEEDDTGTGTATDGGATDGGTTDGGTSDGGTETDGGTQTDGGTETDGGTTDGGTTDGGTITSPLFDDLSWDLHDEIESMVYVTWTQAEAGKVHVEYSYDPDEWYSSPSFDASAGEQQQLLVGIPYDVEAEWRVVGDDSGEYSEGRTIYTGDVPSGLPLGEVMVSEPDRWLPEGNFMLTSINEDVGGWTGGHYWTMIIDREGRPVWAHEAPSRHWTLFVQVSVTKDHFLWDEATYWSDWDDGEGSTVHRTYLDEEIDEIATPGLHHAFVQLPDETLVWGSQAHGGREALVEQAIGATEQTILWTCEDDWPGSGYCESNGLFYSVDRDSFLYSFYTNNSIVEVDHVTGESMWWAGDVRGGYDWAPGSKEFSWQHGISYTEEGTLLLSSHGTEFGRNVTPVIEYEVDHDAELLTEVWSYSPGVYASTNGDAWRLSNGNTLHTIGSSGHIKEVDADGDVVWHVDYDGTHLLGRGELIEDLYTLVSPSARR